MRLRKYVVINEVSQGTFNPHYSLLARITFLRAKLLLFFPRFVPKDETYLATERFSGQKRIEASIHWGRLSLAEMGRLYAAAEGDSETYACYAAFQSWLHLIAAYASAENLTLPTQDRADVYQRPQTLSPEQCLDWARKLRDHALISYADIGRYYYNQIKEKSGLPGQTDAFGPYSIQKLPAVYEARQDQYADWIANRNDDFLVLDMSLMAVNVDDLPKLSPTHPNRNIYLFGTNACYLFFARGLYLLCSDTSEEFDHLKQKDQEIQWLPKLRRAMRLLNVAWAIAEDGGKITEAEEIGQEIRLNIQRTWNNHPTLHTEEYSTIDTDALRDLYPRRVAEINDLSKLFSAVCMALQLQLTAVTERDELANEIKCLLRTIHRNIRQNPTLEVLLSHQERYNGHLSTYIEKAKAILTAHIETTMVTEHVLNSLELKAERDRLVQKIFRISIE